MPEHDPDELEPEPDEHPEEPSFDPYAWVSLARVEVPEELAGVPFN